MAVLERKIVLWVVGIIFLLFVFIWLATQFGIDNPLIQRLLNVGSEFGVD